ncbi:methyltransferase-like protein 6-like protein [Gamsiella multidivaricata]|uniref:methyltransferase-like protein 6-like protein n=1 Tax=Gamsiella multidivaricata TaxID=101098 RepID=UPI00222037B7|nr:methyltransferase-like protein 6-like protein [Gamsiella multidivaricata]KAG0369422.1 Methyltransferase-like protein 6 [Gamsiella multidivaricata]KAI7831410.1 methyltransferase-like protein 6-like protein [Gamsiella multidivaricata]
MTEQPPPSPLAELTPIEARQEKLLQPLETSIISPEKLEYARQVIEKDKAIKPFWVNKYKNEAAKNWDRFYKRNETRFYKDRHWIEREFTIYKTKTSETLNCLEVGCGVGNFIFPVLERNPGLFMYACDFAPHAIELVKQHEDYKQGRCSAFVCDLTKDPLTDTIPVGSLDVVSSIFVLSAIPAEKLEAAVRNIAEVMKSGGMLCFRDYAVYDAAQVKFSSNPGHMLDTNLYVRQDGTLSHFFSTEQIKELFEKEGFTTVECEYVHRETINRAMDISIDRRFLQAKFIKK